MHRAFAFPHGCTRLVACLVVAMAASGCGEDEAAGGSSTNGADAGDRGSRAKASAPDATPATPDRYGTAPSAARPIVRIETSLGPIDIRLDSDAASLTVRNFLNYVRSGHYNQTVFHYVEKGQLILGGGFLEDGTPKRAGPPILNEAQNGRKNTQGTVAMARDAAVIDSATSQFFINLNDAPHLDHAGDGASEFGYCVFGEVVEGLDVAREISAIPTETKVVDGEELSVPMNAVRIESVKVLR